MSRVLRVRRNSDWTGKRSLGKREINFNINKSIVSFIYHYYCCKQRGLERVRMAVSRNSETCATEKRERDKPTSYLPSPREPSPTSALRPWGGEQVMVCGGCAVLVERKKLTHLQWTNCQVRENLTSNWRWWLFPLCWACTWGGNFRREAGRP